MADSYNFGTSSRRRSQSGESWLLAAACIVAILAYIKFGPRSAGDWESAAIQINKKVPGPVLFYPAWHRDVLAVLRDTPIVALDGPTHLDLAGLGQVVFASDLARPEEMVDNLFTLTEIRDFSGKAISILKVADHSLVSDFAELDVSVEDPPGILKCSRRGDAYDCGDRDLVVGLQPASFHATAGRCLWVKTTAAKPVTLALTELEKSPLRQSLLYIGRPDGTPATAIAPKVEVRIDQRHMGDYSTEHTGVWQKQELPTTAAMSRVELIVSSPSGSCFDLELMP